MLVLQEKIIKKERNKNMPKLKVEISWDKPDEQQWLNPDNIAIALHAYCKNTKFEVKENHAKTKR